MLKNIPPGCSWKYFRLDFIATAHVLHNYTQRNGQKPLPYPPKAENIYSRITHPYIP